MTEINVGMIICATIIAGLLLGLLAGIRTEEDRDRAIRTGFIIMFAVPVVSHLTLTYEHATYVDTVFIFTIGLFGWFIILCWFVVWVRDTIKHMMGIMKITVELDRDQAETLATFT